MSSLSKRQRAKILHNAMLLLSGLTPDWMEREGRSKHFSSLLRMRRIKNRWFFVALAVSRSAGDYEYGISASVGWTIRSEYDMSDAIRIHEPSGTLQELLENELAPEWRRNEFFVGIDRLKRRAGIFGNKPISPETFETLREDFEKYGLPFLRAAAARGIGVNDAF